MKFTSTFTAKVTRLEAERAKRGYYARWRATGKAGLFERYIEQLERQKAAEAFLQKQGVAF